MNKIYFVTCILLCANCSNINQQNIDQNTCAGISDAGKFDFIYTEWFMSQTTALDYLAPGKYNFSKFDVTPNDIIEFQKLEIKNNFQNKEKIDSWVKEQKNAIHILNINNNKKIKTVKDFINMLDKQADYINNLFFKISMLDVKKSVIQNNH